MSTDVQVIEASQLKFRQKQTAQGWKLVLIYYDAGFRRYAEWSVPTAGRQPSREERDRLTARIDRMLAAGERLLVQEGGRYCLRPMPSLLQRQAG